MLIQKFKILWWHYFNPLLELWSTVMCSVLQHLLVMVHPTTICCPLQKYHAINVEVAQDLAQGL